MAWLCTLSFCQAQQIKGTVHDTQNAPIVNGYVLFKDPGKPEVIQEFTSIQAGAFSFTLKKGYKTLLVEVKAIGYEKEELLLPFPKDSTYQLVFKLEKEVLQLDEVKITAKKFPFQIQGDTVTFQVSAYAEPSDRKVQDILKKLPGVEVNEKSGEVKYKGKSVETVLLEGDNLFDYNYSIGTKNINVSMVEQIQAIDNYSSNPLLKNIEKEGKVALNLVLKKGKFDFSGSIEAGIGVFSGSDLARYTNATLLGITSRYKSFGVLTANNIGYNEAPGDYFGNVRSPEQLKEKDELAEKLINEQSFSGILGSERMNINNQLVANHHQLVKLSAQTTLKTKLFYQKDRIQSTQFTGVSNLIGGSRIDTYDSTFINKKPQYYRGDLDLNHHLSKKTLFEYHIKYRYENIETPTVLQTNIVPVAKATLDTRDYYFKQKGLLTHKLGDFSALQFQIVHSVNTVPQKYTLRPATFIDTLYGTVRQQSQIKNKVFVSELHYLGVKGASRYSIHASYDVKYVPFESNLTLRKSENMPTTLQSRNIFQYHLNTGAIVLNYQYKIGKFLLSPSTSLIRLDQQLISSQTQSLSQSNLVIMPKGSVALALSKYSKLTGLVSYQQKPGSTRYLFNNEVLINNRIILSNLPNLSLQKTTDYRLVFGHYHFEKFFQLNTGIAYRISNGDYFSDYQITNSQVLIKNFFLPLQNKTLSFDFMASKYIDLLSSTLKFTSSASRTTYQNVVNGSDLRENRSDNMNGIFFIKTAFDFSLNFENTATFNFNNSQSRDQLSFQNSSANNAFKVLWSLSRNWFFSSVSHLYVPRFKPTSTPIHFLDFQVNFAPSQKNYSLSFVLNNLTNERFFEQVQTTDFSIIRQQVNLLPGQVRINFTYNF